MLPSRYNMFSYLPRYIFKEKKIKKIGQVSVQGHVQALQIIR